MSMFEIGESSMPSENRLKHTETDHINISFFVPKNITKLFFDTFLTCKISITASYKKDSSVLKKTLTHDRTLCLNSAKLRGQVLVLIPLFNLQYSTE